MRLKPKIRRILQWIIIGLVLVSMGLLLGFVNEEQSGQLCREVNISIRYTSRDTILSRNDIDSVLNRMAGRLRGKPLWQIHLAQLEQAVLNHPFVSTANVYENTEGKLYVEVTQRQPVVRVITPTNKTFYISNDGMLLSVDSDHPLRVLVVSGSIPEEGLLIGTENTGIRLIGSVQQKPLLNELLALVQYIRDDPFFFRQVEQIYVTESGEFELIPKVGDHIVQFGTIRDMQEKFDRLWAFYIHGLNHIGWNRYATINVKYKNQVVCTKYNQTTIK